MPKSTTRTARKNTANVAADLAAELLAQPLPTESDMTANDTTLAADIATLPADAVVELAAAADAFVAECAVEADAPTPTVEVEADAPTVEVAAPTLEELQAKVAAKLANADAATLLAFIEGRVAKAAKAPKAPKPPKADAAPRVTKTAGYADTLRAMLAASADGVVVLSVADRIALGMSNSAVVHRAYWAPCNPGGKAAAAAGAKVASKANGSGFDVVLTAAA